MKRFAALALVALLGTAAACGGAEHSVAEHGQQSSSTVASGQTTPQETAPAPGGTLRVGLVDWARHELAYRSPDAKASYALDPQGEYDGTAVELFRCCLLRTLMSYNGKPTAEGGAELRPDLVAEPPTVSADGLTWTFRLKTGLRYAPPYDETEILAADVVRALERTLQPAHPAYAEATGIREIGIYAYYYAPLIEGSQAFAAGEADTISGLETPDDHTLLVHLTKPSGDLAHRFSLPATAPIPPGAAEDHDDGYGPFLVSSGPYMLEGYEPGTAITLVRNPSWTGGASDDLRAAYADRIELSVEADEVGAYADVDAGRLDLVLDWQAPAATVERYLADPALTSRLTVIPQDMHFYAAMNLAQPPFDDLHVRRAANLVVAKDLLVDRFGPGGARPATHAAPDSLEGNLLLDYDPYATSGRRGDLAAARAELALSAYDSDGDGRCDDPVCFDIPALAIAFRPTFFPADIVGLLEQDLGQLGLELTVKTAPPDKAFPALANQDVRHAMVLDYVWAKDFPNGSGWFPGTLGVDDPTANPSLVGVDAQRLADWGYPVTSVPSVDSEIAECARLAGGAQTQCWAALDQLVTEQIVPWIPYAAPNEARTFSARVVSVSIDQYANLPALDRIALAPGS